MLRFFIHYFLHLVAPGIIAKYYFREKWIQAWILMLVTLIIDLDHLFAVPVFDSFRCSIGFHPLHSTMAIGLYVALFVIPKTRILAVGFLFHILTDSLDCFMQQWF